jgi:hypothetical protein
MLKLLISLFLSLSILNMNAMAEDDDGVYLEAGCVEMFDGFNTDLLDDEACDTLVDNGPGPELSDLDLSDREIQVLLKALRNQNYQ